MEVPHLLALAGPVDELGSFQTAHKRLVRWAVGGIWERIFAAVPAAAEGADDIGWTVSVDSTGCRAHQHAADARRKGLQAGPNPTTVRSDAPEAV